MRSPTPLLVAAVLLGRFASAQVVFHDDAGKELVAKDARIEVLASELKFTEGPVWIGAQRRLVFSDIPASKLLRWTEDEGVQDFLASEQANGNTLDLAGRLLSCQHGARNVVRREPEDAVSVIASRFDEKLLNSPNDLAVRMDGTVWFTDPSYGLGKREAEQPLRGVYCVAPTDGTVSLVQKDFDQPNGICFSPDHASVWIADSGKHQRIGRFPIGEDGTLGEPLFWIPGGADGIRCDAHGNLWAAQRAGIGVFSPDGKPLVSIAVEPSPTNCAFGGADGRTLFVTARTKLLRIAVLVGAAAIPAREDGEKR
ncbi:MAG: SMP-30/gluconolactonase/LRE family protein [Planctomycetes bacterium]|nr:SMP-30/gluconolactonase/LRE family protein [Planctomycetota bacterium]